MNLFIGSSVFPIRPECPDCAMNKIVAKGLNLDREAQSFECLRCGHIEKPLGRRSQAGEQGRAWLAVLFTQKGWSTSRKPRSIRSVELS
jgi:hypothetical protein